MMTADRRASGGTVTTATPPFNVAVIADGVTPMADNRNEAAESAGLTAPGAREALAVVVASYEHQGGFRLRTLSV